MQAQTLPCATIAATDHPGYGAGTLRDRMHLMLAVSRPGSGLGTLQARMDLMLAVSCPGSSLGTLRACVHAQTLLCDITGLLATP